MYRSVWEISVRLMDMPADPIAASLGYLLAGVGTELSVAHAERTSRIDEDLPSSDALERNIENIEARHTELETLARARGLDPQLIEGKYGRLNFRDACSRLGIERAYLVNYAFASGYAHEKNVATSDFLSIDEDERRFELGPVRDSRIEAVADTLRYLFLAIHCAATVLGDQTASAQAEAALCALEGLPEWPSSEVASA
jgi:hypothetical protein